MAKASLLLRGKPFDKFSLIETSYWSMPNPRPLTRIPSKHKSSPSSSLHLVSLALCLPPSGTLFLDTSSSSFWHFVFLLPELHSQTLHPPSYSTLFFLQLLMYLVALVLEETLVMSPFPCDDTYLLLDQKSSSLRCRCKLGRTILQP